MTQAEQNVFTWFQSSGISFDKFLLDLINSGYHINQVTVVETREGFSDYSSKDPYNSWYASVITVIASEIKKSQT